MIPCAAGIFCPVCTPHSYAEWVAAGGRGDPYSLHLGEASHPNCRSTTDPYPGWTTAAEQRPGYIDAGTYYRHEREVYPILEPRTPAELDELEQLDQWLKALQLLPGVTVWKHEHHYNRDELGEVEVIRQPATITRVEPSTPPLPDWRTRALLYAPYAVRRPPTGVYYPGSLA